MANPRLIQPLLSGHVREIIKVWESGAFQSHHLPQATAHQTKLILFGLPSFFMYVYGIGLVVVSELLQMLCIAQDEIVI